MRILILFIIISVILSIVSIIITGKVRGFIIVGSAIFAIVVDGILNINSLELKTPEYAINEEQTAVYLIAPEDGVGIEYRTKTGDVGQAQWKKYKDNELIIIDHNPTKLDFRSKYYWKTSDIVEKECHINEYGQVWIDIPPDVPITTISASYRGREPENGQPGNMYVGYTISPKDITVKGTDTKGDDIDLKDFSFTPSKLLKEGENTIEVEYITDNGQKHNCSLSVFAKAPELLSLNAAIKNKDDKITIGTTLTTDMFDVTGTYENGEKKKIESFLVDPINVDEEREYTLVFSKGNISDTLKIDVIDPAHISEKEVEDNSSIDTANNIEPNGRYSGSLFDKEDVDYYRLRIKNKGSVQISFSHPKVDDTSTFWAITLMGQEEGIFTEYSSGATSEMQTRLARVTPGVYYIKIARDYYSDKEYTFSVLFNQEDEYYESEPNDEISNATAIEPNADNLYTGNLTTKEDKDYYYFSIPSKGKVRVQLDHTKWDDDNAFWNLHLLDDTDYTVTSLSACGNAASEKTGFVRLSPGTYYIRVERDYWDNRDYHLSVQFFAEEEGAETEPNNDYGDATIIQLNQRIVGNIQSSKDVDFYEIDLDEADSLKIEFGHEKFDNSSTFWKVELFGLSSDSIKSTEGRTCYYISGDDPSNITFEWQGLNAGQYYIKISRDYYENADYSIVATT